MEEARETAEKVMLTIGPLVERAEVAGSIRRQRPYVHDVDIVLIPKAREIVDTGFWSPLTPFPDGIAARLNRELGAELLRKGEKMLQMRIQGTQVDLYASTPEAWGIHLLRWTGSRAHNIYLCTVAQSRGLRLAVSAGVVNGRRIVASRTEEDVFRALGLEYVPPERRQ